MSHEQHNCSPPTDRGPALLPILNPQTWKRKTLEKEREPASQLTLIYILSLTLYDMEYSTGQSGTVALAMPPPSC